MNWLRLSVVLLQVLTALSLKCTLRNGKHGFCTMVDDCTAFNDMDPPYTHCGKTGLYCCPLREHHTLSKPSIDPKFPKSCGQTPMYGSPHITGGHNIKPDEFSWLASLQYGNRDTYGACSASVINSLYLLTAAHCVQSKRILEIGGVTAVRLGDFEHERKCDYGSDECIYYQEFGVERTIVHENYIADSPEIAFDIALIRVKSRIPLGPNVKPICLPIGHTRTVEPMAGTIMTTTGWGQPEKLAKRAVNIPLWSKSKCALYGSLDSRQICAGARDRGNCFGDSGGPLMHSFETNRWVLEGIVSYAYKCGSPIYPTVYTRVRSFLGWINKNMDMKPTQQRESKPIFKSRWRTMNKKIQTMKALRAQT